MPMSPRIRMLCAHLAAADSCTRLCASQKAQSKCLISSKTPRAGGILWFCIPFTLATCLGLASRALDLPLTAAEAGEGLVPPAAATYLLGKGGAILIILMLFMAVTSSGAFCMTPVC